MSSLFRLQANGRLRAENLIDYGYQFGSTPSEELVLDVSPDRRTHVLTGVAADKEYSVAVAPYRNVDADINATGKIKGFQTILGASGLIPNPSMLTIADIAISLSGLRDAAAAAQTDASSVIARVNSISNDSILDRSEKPDVISRLAAFTAEKNGILDTASALGIVVEATAYANAYSTLVTYLNGLIPAYTDKTQDTPIVRTTFDARFNDYLANRQAVLNKTSSVASTLANWNNVTGAGKPADNATSDITLSIATGTDRVTILGNTAWKNAGAPAWDSFIMSKEYFANSAIISFTLPNANTISMTGLCDAAPTAAQISGGSLYNSLNYCVRRGTGSWNIYEPGGFTMSLNTAYNGVTFSSSTVWTITYDGVNTNYYADGVVMRTVAAVPNKTFYAGSAFYTGTTTPSVANMKITSFTDNNWASVGGVNKPADNATVGAPAGTKVGNTIAETVEKNAANSSNITMYSAIAGDYTFNGNLITKVAGGNGWGSAAFSQEFTTGAAQLSFKLPVINAFVGLDSVPSLATVNSYTTIDYAWHYSGGSSNWQIYESGTSRFAGTSFGGVTFGPNTFFVITYDGKNVKYWADAVLVRTVATTDSRTFYVGAALSTIGGYISNVSYGAYVDNSLVNTDPAARVNVATTLIDPGKILISGTTKLSDWRNGTDVTKIEGGSIAANTVDVNKLTVGARGLTMAGLEFTANWTGSAYQLHRLYWSAGSINYINNLNAAVTVSIAAGSVVWSSGVVYLYWVQGATTITTTTAISTAYGANNVVLATYSGGANLNVTYGRTIIDGSKITTGTISAAAITAGTLTAAQMAANSITTAKMAITDFTNFATNGDLSMGNINWANSIISDATNAYLGTNVIALPGGAGAKYISNDNIFTVKAGDQFYLEWWGKASSDMDSSFNVYLRINNAAGSQILTSNVGSITAADQVYRLVSGNITIPANAYNAYLQINYNNTVGTGYVGMVRLRRKNEGSLIVDGGITAQKLVIGQRGVDIASLNFQGNYDMFSATAVTNRVSWNGGTISYTNDAGAAATVTIPAASTNFVNWTSGIVYLYWTIGATTISNTTSNTTAYATTNVVLATYAGGTNLNVTYGGTIIDGSKITTGTIDANKLIANSVLAGTITVGGVGGTNTLANAFNSATWAGVTGSDKPRDNAGNIVDTRATDELPSYYYGRGKGETQEFKNGNFSGSASSGYGTLITTTQWADPSGGPVKQLLTDSTHTIFIRVSTSTTTWGTWAKDYSSINKPTLGGDILSSTGVPVTDAMALNSQANYQPIKAFTFDTTIEGFTFANATATAAGGTMTVTGTSASTNPIFISTNLSTPGSQIPIIRMRARPLHASPTMNGAVYYETQSNNHGQDSNYYKRILNPGLTQNVWQIFEWDMSALSAGGTDWMTQTITRVRFDMGNQINSIWEIDWVSFGSILPAGVMVGTAKAQDLVNDVAASKQAVSDIANDNILSINEKSDIIREYARINTSGNTLGTQLTAFNLSRTAIDSSYSALTNYLNSLTSWNNVTVATPIDGPTFRARFNDFYTAETAAISLLAGTAALLATWDGVAGTNKPADNATSDLVMYASPGSTTPPVITGNTVVGFGAAASGWTNLTVSRNSFTGGAAVTGQLNNVSTFLGLTTTINSSGTSQYNVLNYSVHCSSATKWFIYELGNGIDIGSSFTGVTFSPTTTWQITYDGVNVKYYADNVLIRTATTTPNLKMYAGVCIGGASLTVSKISFTSFTDNNWASVGGSNKPADNATVGAIAGTNLKDSTGTSLVDVDIRNNTDSSIRSPGGGLYVTSASSVTGGLKITLPVAFTSTMMKFTVDIYEYSAGLSCTLDIGGYNYTVNETWINVSAKVMGGSNVEYPVRFGKDSAGKAAIWIGEATETWAYPQVRVRDFMAGFSNYSRAMWEKGWVVGFDTTAATNVTASVLDTYPAADWRKVVGTGRPENNATVGAKAGTNLLDATGTVLTDTSIKNSQANYQPIKAFTFDNSTEGFGAGSATVAASGGTLTVTGTADDPVIYSPALVMAGSTIPIIRIRARPLSASPTWDGTIFYETTTRGFDGAYIERIPNPGIIQNQWMVFEWDMTVLTSGGSDWMNSTINRIRIDLATNAQVWEIDWISLGAILPAGVMVGGTLAKDIESQTIAATKAITDISNDNVLTTNEKSDVIREWNRIDQSKNNLVARSDALGVPRTDLVTAYNNASAYLLSLFPAWSDVTKNTPIDGPTFRSYFQAFYAQEAFSTSKITEEASKRAQWSGTTGSGKPETYTVMARGNQTTTLPSFYQHGLRGSDGQVFIDSYDPSLRSDSYARSYTLMWRVNPTYWAVRNYDVYGNQSAYPNAEGNGAANSGLNLATQLNQGIGVGTPIVIYTSDEPSSQRLLGGLPDAMYRCGASRTIFGSPNFTGWSSYVLIGTVGAGEGNGVELFSAGGPNSFVMGSFSIVNGIVMMGGKTLKDASDIAFTDGRSVNALNTVQAGATVGAPAGTMVGDLRAEDIATYITNISSDNILSKSEKSSFIQLANTATAQYQEANATSASFPTSYGAELNLSTRQTADNAFTNLNLYLGTISPGWSDPSSDSPIDGPTFRAKFQTLLDTTKALQISNNQIASTKAIWNSVGGAGKPADYATASDNYIANGAFSSGTLDPWSRAGDWNIGSEGTGTTWPSKYAAVWGYPSGGTGQLFSNRVTAPPKRVHLSAWVWMTHPQNFQFVARTFNSSGGIINYRSLDGSQVTPTTWSFVSGWIDLDANTSSVDFYFQIANAAGAGTIYVTSVRVSATEYAATVGAPVGTLVGGTPAANVETQAANSGNLTLYDPSGSQYIILGNRVQRKSGGSWSGNVFSRDFAVGTAQVSATLPVPDTFIGLSDGRENPAGSSYSAFDYSWHFSADGGRYYFENGSGVSLGISSNGVNFDQFTLYQITYDGLNVRYYANGVVMRTVATTTGRVFYAGVSIGAVGQYLTGVSLSANVDNSLANADPAARINQPTATTKIDPGKIVIQGSTTLADWKAGANLTTIAGGQIAADSISANKLSIGLRGVDIQGIEFTANWNVNVGAANVLTWSQGSITYWGDNGTVGTPQAISQGTTTWSSGIIYIYWTKGTGSLLANVNISTAYGPNNIVLATYSGGTNLVVTYGRTVVDGSKITTGTIQAAQIAAGAISVANLYVGATTEGLLANGGAESGTTDGWQGQGSVVAGGNGSAYCHAIPPNSGAGYYSKAFPVTPGKTYVFSWSHRASAATGGGTFFRVLYQTGKPGYVAGGSIYTDLYSNGAATTGWVSYNPNWTAPANAQWVSVVLYNTNTGPTLYFDDIQVFELVNGTRIADGAISTNKMQANSIDADRITSGTISVNKFVASSRQFSAVGLNMRVGTDGNLVWDNANVYYAKSDGSMVSGRTIAGNYVAAGQGIVRLYFYVADGGTNTNLDIRFNNALDLENHPLYKLVAIWRGGADLTVAAGVGTSINGDAIVTGSINADRIAAYTILSNFIKVSNTNQTLNLGDIHNVATDPAARINAVGTTIDGGKITTGTITARQITLGNTDNIIPDADFRDVTFWVGDNPTSSMYVGAQNSGWTFPRYIGLNGNNGAFDRYGRFFPVEPGATYKVRVGIYVGQMNSGGWLNAVIHMPNTQWFSLKTGLGMGNPAVADAPYGFTTNYDSRVQEFIVTNPTGITDNANRQWQFRFAGNFTGYAEIMVSITRVSDSTLIQDGSISTNKMTVNSIDAKVITTGTIMGEKISTTTNLPGTITVGNTGVQIETVREVAQSSANLTWYEGDGTVLGQHRIAGNRITKLQPNGGWNSNCYTREIFFGGCSVSGRLSTSDTFIGIVTNRQFRNGNDYQFLDYSFYRSGDGNYYAYESGGNVQNFGSASSLTYVNVSIVYDGRTVRYYSNGNIVREVATTENRGFSAGVAIAPASGYVEGLQFIASADNSLSRADPAARINANSTNISPGRILIQGGTMLSDWKNGGDSTEIRGGAIAANTVTANKITIGNRGINMENLIFEVIDVAGGKELSWNNDGYIIYTNSSNNLDNRKITAGNTYGVAKRCYVYWQEGANNFLVTNDYGTANQQTNVVIATYQGGTVFVANYGGTIINGDRISTNSIAANKLSVGSLSAISANIGSLVSYNGAGGRVERDGNGTRVYYNNGNLAVKIGF
jgi:hypothetical protein